MKLFVVFIVLVFVCGAFAKKSKSSIKPFSMGSQRIRSTQRLAGCFDMFLSCPRWAELGACSSPNYTLGQKKAYCRKTCNLCDTSTDQGDDDQQNDDNNSNGTDNQNDPLQTLVDALRGLKNQYDQNDG